MASCDSNRQLTLTVADISSDVYGIYAQINTSYKNMLHTPPHTGNKSFDAAESKCMRTDSRI